MRRRGLLDNAEWPPKREEVYNYGHRYSTGITLVQPATALAAMTYTYTHFAIKMSACLLAWLSLLQGALTIRAPYFGGDSPSSFGSDSPQPFYPGEASPYGYQFSSFRGPVSGRIREIEVPYALPPGVHGTPYSAAGGPPAMSFDYVAKPDYAYTFGVHDPESGNAQKQYEARDGDTVRGEYSFMEPDGTLRTVTYTADSKNGFQANVKYGPSGLPPPPPPTPSPSPGYTGAQGRYTGPQGRSKHARPYRQRAHRPSYSSIEDGDY